LAERTINFESGEQLVDHECSLTGIVLNEPSSQIYPLLHAGMDAQNHRGEEAAGIAWVYGGRVRVTKDLGLRQAALPDRAFLDMSESAVAIGHTRYSTAGNPDVKNAQPFLFNDGQFALAHNGNVHWEIPPAAGEPTSDTYGVGKMIASGPGSTIQNTIATLGDLNGAYAFIFVTPDGLFAARDPWGFRPLIYGQLGNGIMGSVVTSESVGSHDTHASNLKNIPRGTLVKIEPDGFNIVWEDSRIAEIPEAACSFEHAYFSDAASRVNVERSEQTNHELRVFLGRSLHNTARPVGEMVVAVPNSGRSYAEGVALQSGLPLLQAIQTNRHAGRNFIKPSTPEERKRAAHNKYRFIPELINNRDLIIVDDSLVRGSTAAGIILSLFEHGANHIELLLGTPPITHPCYWGIDFQDPLTLIYNQLIKNGDQESFELKLAEWLVAGDKQLLGRLRVSFQKLDNYKSIIQGIGKTVPIEHSGGCYHCVSGIVPIGALADVNMAKHRFDH